MQGSGRTSAGSLQSGGNRRNWRTASHGVILPRGAQPGPDPCDERSSRSASRASDTPKAEASAASTPGAGGAPPSKIPSTPRTISRPRPSQWSAPVIWPLPLARPGCGRRGPASKQHPLSPSMRPPTPVFGTVSGASWASARPEVLQGALPGAPASAGWPINFCWADSRSSAFSYTAHATSMLAAGLTLLRRGWATTARRRM